MAVVLRVKGDTIPITDVSVAAHAVEKGVDLVPADCHCEAVNRLLAYTGLRLGKALGLTWEHVDLDDSYLPVRQSLRRRTGQKWCRRPRRPAATGGWT